MPQHITRFTVPGIPAMAESKEPWMNQVALFANQIYHAPPMLGAVKLVIEFTFLRPKSHFGTGRNSLRLKPFAPAYMTKKPAVSKMVRAVEDALTGIVWKDASQVVRQDALKRYGDRPGAEITIIEIGAEQQITGGITG